MTISGLQEKINQELAVNYDRCLSGDTKVPLLDGRTLSILELLKEYGEGKTNYVYSCSSTGKVGGSKIEKVWSTGKKEALRVWLDNGKFVDASYNHEFFLRDGSTCLAENLQVGQSLMPFHRRKLKKNKYYEGIWDIAESKWKSTYKVMYESFYKVAVDRLNEGLHAIKDSDFIQVIHHVDFNKHNNNPDNFQLMTSLAHMLLHAGNGEFLKVVWANYTPEQKELRVAIKVLSQLGLDLKGISDEQKIQRYRELMEVELHTCECKSQCGQTFWKRKTGPGSDRRFMPGHDLIGRVRSEEEYGRVVGAIRERQAKLKGKTFEEIYGFEKASEMKEKQSLAKRGKLSLRKLPTEIRNCGCLCGGTFECKVKSKQRFIWGHNRTAQLKPSYNHKVVKIERVGLIDVYDLNVTGNHTFGLDVGIFIHNCNLYLEVMNATSHPIMSAALEAYANYSTVYSRENQATIWVTSDNSQYRATIEKLFERINIEEKIYDWAYAIAMGGDLFAKINGQPGLGIVSIDDSRAPIEYFRIENNGQLIGFYHQVFSDATRDNSKLLPPWSHVHFMAAGARKRRSTYGDSFGYRTCLKGNTKVALLSTNETPTIQEMAENEKEYVGKFVYSVNPKTLVIEADEIVNVKKTKKNAELVRVHLDNGEQIECTPCHRFMMRDGSFQRADLLKLEDSLMPLYKRVKGTSYKIYNPADGSWKAKTDLILTEEFLTDLYKDKKLSIAAIRLVTGCGYGYIAKYLKERGNLTRTLGEAHPSTYILTKEYLVENYINKRLSVNQLVKLTGCDKESIRSRLRKYGLTIRKQKNNYEFDQKLTKEFLQKYYIEKKLSIREISKLCDCAAWTVDHYLEVYGIPLRDRGEVSTIAQTKYPRESDIRDACTAEFLQKHYVEEGKTKEEIADLVGCTASALTRYLKKAGIELRERRWWKGIYSPIEKYLRFCPEYFEWRQGVLQSDNCRCRKCSSKENLEAHHKTPFFILVDKFLREYSQFSPVEDLETLIRLALPHVPFWDISNGETLCEDCHRLIYKETIREIIKYKHECEYKNHKVVRVEKLSHREDVYDLETKKNHNFAISSGIFVHNSIIGVGGNTFQESTHYGSPLLMPGLPVYKRLRLSEDSVLMARATRGVTKYLYALGVDGSNAEAVSSLITQYANILKRARSIDTTSGETSYSDRLNNMNVAEDVLIPIWGDVGQLKIEKLGGEVDIKWITDVEKLESQLITALAVPRPLLGGNAGDNNDGFDNGGSLARMDVRFGRSVRRLQRAIIQGVTRMCQIHLAYLSMDPDPKLFQVHMNETSTAEEEEQKATLKTGIEASDMLVDLMIKFIGDDNIDRKKAFEFVNDSILHLKDFKYRDFVKEGATALANPNSGAAGEGEATVTGAEGQPQQLQQQHVIDSRKGGDLQSMTIRDQRLWESMYSNVDVKVELDEVTKKRLLESR